MSRGTRSTSGFAALYGIILLGLAASAVAFLYAWVARDASRMRTEQADAQLRLLVRAQADLALRDGSQLALPAPLRDAGFLVSAKPQQASLEIRATVGRRTIAERIDLRDSRVADVRLIP